MPTLPKRSLPSGFHNNITCLCLPYLIHVVQAPGIHVCHPQLCHPNRICCRAAISEIWLRSSTQQPLHPCNAGRDLISETRNKNISNSIHYCFIRFPPQKYSKICCNTVNTTYLSYQNINRRPISNVPTAQPNVVASQISPDIGILVTKQQGQTSHWSFFLNKDERRQKCKRLEEWNGNEIKSICSVTLIHDWF